MSRSFALVGVFMLIVSMFLWSNRDSSLMSWTKNTSLTNKYSVGDCLEVPSTENSPSDLIRINKVNSSTYNVSLWYNNKFNTSINKDISMSGIDLVTTKVECP